MLILVLSLQMFNSSTTPEHYVKDSVLALNDSSVLMPAVTSATHLLNTSKNGLGSPIVIQAVCATLNINTESRICFGFTDERVVSGIILDREQRDKARLAWDHSTSEIFPRLTHKQAAIYFAPIVTTKTLKRIHDTFIVEIHLKPLTDVLYSLKKGERCFLRNGNSNFEMRTANVRHLAIHRKMMAHSGTIQGLLADIAKLKEDNNNDIGKIQDA
uniref:Schlafen AlbA-2 domain-containing protein n=1 Tax=Strigamia maritima TaxID=126957 RepID=T1IKG1_STRMM